MNPDIRSHASPALAARDLAQAVADDLRAGLDRRGVASLILSASPALVPFLQSLREQALDWSRITLVPSDECWVDAREPESREGLLRRHLVRDAVLDATVISLRASGRRPLDAIVTIGELLSRLPRPFDAVVLEAGAGGEVAALHPGMPGLEAMLNPTWAVQAAPAQIPGDPLERVTLTLRPLLDTQRLHLWMSAMPEPGSPAAALLRSARTALRVIQVAT